jgi:hypothetical protein
MQASSLATWNTDRIIEDIQTRRVTLIKELSVDQQLDSYLVEMYEGQKLSPVKSEFLKRDLKQLSESSLDLVHYATLIRKAKESESWPNPPVHAEIRQVVVKYIA